MTSDTLPINPSHALVPPFPSRQFKDDMLSPIVAKISDQEGDQECNGDQQPSNTNPILIKSIVTIPQGHPSTTQYAGIDGRKRTPNVDQVDMSALLGLMNDVKISMERNTATVLEYGKKYHDLHMEVRQIKGNYCELIKAISCCTDEVHHLSSCWREFNTKVGESILHLVEDAKKISKENINLITTMKNMTNDWDEFSKTRRTIERLPIIPNSEKVRRQEEELSHKEMYSVNAMVDKTFNSILGVYKDAPTHLISVMREVVSCRTVDETLAAIEAMGLHPDRDLNTMLKKFSPTDYVKQERIEKILNWIFYAYAQKRTYEDQGAKKKIQTVCPEPTVSAADKIRSLMQISNEEYVSQEALLTDCQARKAEEQRRQGYTGGINPFRGKIDPCDYYLGSNNIL